MHVSSTLGEIATIGNVTENGGGSVMRLHTINGTLVGSITTVERITAVCFSNAPEGVSVNAVVTGLDDGSIK